jgi:hypothetical protein
VGPEEGLQGVDGLVEHEGVVGSTETSVLSNADTDLPPDHR